jgi:hypothetical protein
MAVNVTTSSGSISVNSNNNDGMRVNKSILALRRQRGNMRELGVHSIRYRNKWIQFV